ncbi:YitT family protein [Heliophilum fasciatum]|nr:YitT family protein [Heliophilum fasciatum]MCW2277427.1 uncharacterized membrane-anchored protein YitT (DUF2179 family) [Heliophilum fasciatum]
MDKQDWQANVRYWVKDLLIITLGSGCFALGLNYFIIANRLAEGGLTGIALIVHYLLGWPVGITYMVMNIPLFFFGWRLLGSEFAWKTLAGTMMVSFAVDITGHWQHPMPDDLLLAALYGGVAMGLGLGLIFLAGGSSAGADIVARVVNRRWGWPIGRVLLMIDVVVIALVGLIFGQAIAMYTLVAVFVASRVIDFVQEGAYRAKAVMIISDCSEEIAREVVEKLERGATLFGARGAYTKLERQVLYCVISRAELVRLKSLVYGVDPRAFMIVQEAYEVLGEGFRDWRR